MKGGAVAFVEGEVVAGLDLVAEQGRVPVDMADHLPRIGIDQELAGIEAMPCRGLVVAVHAIAVDRAGPRIRQVAVPDLVGVFGQGDPLDLAVAPGIEQAELDLGRMRREQGEVDAEPVPCRTERVG